MRNISDKHLENMSLFKRKISALFHNTESKVSLEPIDKGLSEDLKNTNQIEIQPETKTPLLSRNPFLKLIRGVAKLKNSATDSYELDEEEGADLPQLCDITLHQTEFLFRSDFSPLKQVYIDSMKKLQNSKDRPLHQLLLIHQTILKVNSTAFATGVHPLLLHRRLSERTILPKTVNRNSPVSGRHPLATCFKASTNTPPPPYCNNTFEMQETQPPKYHERSGCKDKTLVDLCNRTVQQIC